MGIKEVILFLMISFHLCYTLGNNLVSAHSEEDADAGGRKGIVHRNFFAHGGGSGGRGHSGSQSAEEGNNGSSTSPNKGEAVIPVYAAAASNKQHHSSSCNQSGASLSTLFTVIVASLFVHSYVVLWN